MFERPRSGERVVLVRMDLGSAPDPDELAEFTELAISAGAVPVATITGRRREPDPRLFVGTGKVSEIKQQIAALDAELVIFDHSLSPSQERNLERELGCRVVDRTGLILDIFAQRARSFEGKLQVELAQLRHMSTRLIRGWTHLERQKGGIGLRGPGETQLETDRRLIGDRISQIKGRLRKVESQRAQGRRARDRALVPTVSLVGYTNAGKSTLFNRLTDAGVYEADKLFATLDPTLRRVRLPGDEILVLADTVGFINRLPHDLVAAFRATLEETSSADLLIHVVDASNPRRRLCIEEVNRILQQIGADKIPQIHVFNKIDMLDQGKPRVERRADSRVKDVWLSAKTGEGVDLLTEALLDFFREEQVRHTLRLLPGDGRLRARLFACGEVVADRPMEDGGWEMEVELPRREFERLTTQEASLRHRLLA